MKFFPIVWRNLLRRKVRTTFTLLSVFVAFVLFGILMAIRVAFSAGITIAGAERLMMIDKISLINTIPRSLQTEDRVDRRYRRGVRRELVRRHLPGSEELLRQHGGRSETWLRIYPEFQMPEEQKKAWLADRTGAIVGVDTARRFGWKIGDKVPLQGVIYRTPTGAPWEFTIDGIYEPKEKGVDRTQFFFHYDYLNETVRSQNYGRDQVGWYMIELKDPSQAEAIAKQLDGMFANSHNETKTATEKAFVAGWAKQIGDIGSIMIAIAGAVLFTILLVSANTMAQAIRERTNELAILKTLGFSDTRILMLVLVESCLIAIVGGGLGLAVSWPVVNYVGLSMGNMMPPLYLPAADLVLGAAIILVLGFTTGLWPAIQASRLRIVDALRKG